MRGRPFPTDSPIIVQVPHHNNILLGGGVLCVLNWGGRGGKKAESLNMLHALLCLSSLGQSPSRPAPTACWSCQLVLAHPVPTAGQGGETDV